MIIDIYPSEVSLVILVLRRLRQEDHECEGSPGYIVRPCLKIITNSNNSNKTMKLGAMVHTYKFSTWESESGRCNEFEDSLGYTVSKLIELTH